MARLYKQKEQVHVILSRFSSTLTDLLRGGRNVHLLSIYDVQPDYSLRSYINLRNIVVDKL